jgi:RNA polymerase sigma-70 factor (ECF subfamily)
MVLRRCRRLLNNEEEAVDAMQDVFVQLIRNRDRLEDRAPSSLLYRMATNVCLNRIRSRKRKPETRDDELVWRIAITPSHEERSAARRALDRIFAREQPSTRTIAVMHLLDRMTLDEVAREVGMSVSGVRKRLRALRAHVRELEAV